MRLLIIDDDAEDRALFIEAVREVDETIECQEINNGESALELLLNSQAILPDCIFLDLRMPRVSGKKCLVEIKKNKKLKDIPVYIYTTSKDVQESKELREIGAFHFISKPNNAEDIYFVISLALEEREKLNLYQPGN